MYPSIHVYKQNIKDIKETQTWVKRHLIRLHVFKYTNIQTIKHTNKKVRSKLKRNKESQEIKYITNSKTKQLKILKYIIVNTRIQTNMFSCKQYYKYNNKLYISNLTAQRNTRKTNSNFQRIILSNIFVFKHTKN